MNNINSITLENNQNKDDIVTSIPFTFTINKYVAVYNIGFTVVFHINEVFINISKDLFQNQLNPSFKILFSSNKRKSWQHSVLACCLIKTESIKSQNHRFCLEVFFKNKRKGVFCCGVCKDNDVVW